MSHPEVQEKKRRIGPALIGVLTILACIAFGGWIIWSAFFSSGDESTVIGKDDPPTNHRRDEQRVMWQAMQANLPDGVHMNRRGGGPIFIKAGQFQMYLTKAPKSTQPPWFYLEPLNMDDVIKPDEMQLFVMRSRVLKDKAVADYIKASPEQINKVKKAGGGGGMILTQPQIKSMQAAWANYENANGDAKKTAEKQLVTLVSDISQQSLEPTKKAVADRVAILKETFTPEQIELFQKMGK